MNRPSFAAASFPLSRGLSRFRCFCFSLVASVMACAASPATAQALVPGDIAITRMNLDTSDGFSFVPLVAIEAGTQIHFTGFGWRGSDFNLGAAESFVRWTAPAGGVAAGTVVNIDEATTENTFTTSSGSTVMLTGYSADAAGDRWDLRTGGGDTLLAFTGAPESPNFIAGAAMEDNWNVSYWNPATDWALPNPPYAGSVNSSSLPAALTNGTTAVSIFPPSIPANNGGMGIEKDNARYKAGVMSSGTRAQLLAAINNYQNWENDDTTAYASPAVASFTISSGSSTTVSSLSRANGTPTNSGTVNWTLTFGSAVTGVTASHFTLGGTSTGAAVGTPSTGNGGLTWTVPVTTGTDGTLLLRLDNDTGLSSDVSTTLPFVGETYTVDKTPPDTTIAAFPSNPSPFSTASFSFTGSDSGSGLASFQVQLDGAGFASGSSPANYTALANGSHTFQVRAVDAAGNMDPTPASYAWIVDTTPPQILSINRQNPSGQGISATGVTFRVTYSKPVTLNAPATARFAVVPVGGSSITGTVTGVSGSGVTRDVTVSITGGTGEFRLRAVD